MSVYLADARTLLTTGTEGEGYGWGSAPGHRQLRGDVLEERAVNVMICITALSYIYYRRANRTMTISWARAGNIALGALFGLGGWPHHRLVDLRLYLPASLRVALSGPQAVTTLLVVAIGLLLNRRMLRGATIHGPVQWGFISIRGMVGLFGLAAAFTWVMGLMGYIRSSGRLAWHVNELMPDTPRGHLPRRSALRRRW